MATDILLQF